MTPRTRNESGLTLVEVVVASALAFVGVAGVLSTFPVAHRVTVEAGRVTVLNQLAVERLERLRALSWSDSSLTVGLHPTRQLDSGGQGYFPAAGWPEQYSLKWTVSTGPTNGSGAVEANLKTVVVEASFGVRYAADGTPTVNSGSVRVTMRTLVAY